MSDGARGSRPGWLHPSLHSVLLQILPIWKRGLLVVAAALAATWGTWSIARAGSKGATPFAAGDTVAVYGPQVFQSPTGTPTYGVERFALQLSPSAQYVLRIDVGDASGGKRPDTVVV